MGIARTLATGALGALMSAASLAAATAADMGLRGAIQAFDVRPAAGGVEWGGVYGGVHAGVGTLQQNTYGFASRHSSRILNDPIFLNNTVFSSGAASTTATNAMAVIDPIRSLPVLLGAFAGYQIQFDDAVIGAEVDYTRLVSKNSVTTLYSVPFPGADQVGAAQLAEQYATRATMHEYFTGRFRFGWALGRFMPYMTVGVAYGLGRASVTYAAQTRDAPTQANPNPAVTNQIEVSHSTATQGFGYSGGLGVDALITNNLFLRAEYQYVTIPSLGAVAADMHSVRAGVGVRY